MMRAAGWPVSRLSNDFKRTIDHLKLLSKLPVMHGKVCNYISCKNKKFHQRSSSNKVNAKNGKTILTNDHTLEIQIVAYAMHDKLKKCSTLAICLVIE